MSTFYSDLISLVAEVESNLSYQTGSTHSWRLYVSSIKKNYNNVHITIELSRA